MSLERKLNFAGIHLPLLIIQGSYLYGASKTTIYLFKEKPEILAPFFPLYVAGVVAGTFGIRYLYVKSFDFLADKISNHKKNRENNTTNIV